MKTFSAKVDVKVADLFEKNCKQLNKTPGGLLKEFISSFNNGVLRIEKSNEELKKINNLYVKKKGD